jgi:hypothetical protein
VDLASHVVWGQSDPEWGGYALHYRQGIPIAADVAETGSTAPRHPIRIFPNPFSESVSIQVCETEGDRVEAAIVDVSGRTLRRLPPVAEKRGGVAFRWDGNDSRGIHVAPGVYYVRAISGGRERTGSLSRVR